MESYGLDMDDIFFTEAAVDDDIANAAPMPDLDDDDQPINRNLDESDEAGGEDGDTDADVLKKLKDLSKGAAKKRVMKPQPKLDLERLQTKRGLDALPGLFKDVKFKGKGYEAKDLSLLMGKLEHWAHRLFPKLPFDDFVERLEKLGGKKSVQTCIKRIRLDMNVSQDEEIVRGLSEDEEDGAQAKEGAGSKPQEEITDLDAEEAYEEMMRQEREMMEKRKKQETESFQTPSKNVSVSSSKASPHKDNSELTSTPSSASKGLTAAQIERMERNRQLALEKRMAKLGKTPTGQKSSGLQSSQSSATKPAEKSQTSDDTSREPTTSQSLSKEKGKVADAQGSTHEDTEAMIEDNSDNMQSQESESLQLRMTATETLKSQESDKTDGRNTSDVVEPMDSDDISLRLMATASSEVETRAASSVEENLDLQMTATEESENLCLHLTETDRRVSESEDPDVLLEGVPSGESKDNKNGMSERKDSENKSLKLKLSVTDDEGSMDTD